MNEILPYLDMAAHVLVQVVHCVLALGLDPHVHLCGDVWGMVEGRLEFDALGLAVDHLGHLDGGVLRGRGRGGCRLHRGGCRLHRRGLGRSAGDGCCHKEKKRLGDGNHGGGG